MPHGTPDWGLVGPKETVYGLDDLAEHAVRLGTPHLWDRRGDGVWMSDFREGLGDVGTRVGGGAGGSVVLHTVNARQGAYCVKLTTDDLDLEAALVKHLPYPVFSRLGIEITFGCGGWNDYIEVIGDLRDAVGTWLPEVRWDPTGGTIICRIGLAAWHTMTTTQMAYAFDPCSNSLKMVFDVSLGTYVRVIANDVLYGLTAQPLYHDPAVGTPHFAARVGQHADPGRNAVIYMDNFIVTQNEP